MSYNFKTEDDNIITLEDGGRVLCDSPLYFAEIDGNNIVTRVIVIHQSDLMGGQFGTLSNFIPTSYNGSYGGKYAGIGNVWNPGSSLFTNS